MSMGLNALRAIVDAGSITRFYAIKKAWFVDDELPAYEFIQRHVKRYSAIPDLNTLRENGIVLSAVTQPLDYYVDRIANRAVYLAVSEKHSDLVQAMQDKNTDRVKIALAQMVQATRVVDSRQDYSTMSENSDFVMDKYRHAKRHPGMQGITLGHAPLDEITNGAQGGDVIVLAGRPNVGKSYLLLNMMGHAHRAGYAPMLCSMEMTSSQLATRYIGMEGKINPDLIRKGELSTRWGEPRLVSTIDRLKNQPPLHFIEGNFRKSVADVNSMVQMFSPDILYIDAGYLLRPEKENRNYSKADYIGMVMEEIKCMAQDRNIPVVMSVQLNREASKNMHGRKKNQLDLSHIAGTDVIAQAATVCIGITPGKPPHEERQRQCQILKNREGALLTYSVNFRFNPPNFDYIIGSELEDDMDSTPEQSQALQNEVRQMEEAGWEA